MPKLRFRNRDNGTLNQSKGIRRKLRDRVATKSSSVAVFGAVAAVASLLSGGQLARATTLYWDLNQGTTNSGTSAAGTWDGVLNRWNTDSTGGSGGTTTATAGIGDDLVFSSGTNYNSTTAATITVSGARAGQSFTLEEGTLTFSGTSSPSLTIGSGGITLVNGLNGTATFSTTLPITLAASQSWTNNTTTTARTLQVNASVTGSAASGTQTLTSAGTSSGNTTIAGIVSDGLVGGNVALVQNGANALQLDGANTFTGGTTLTSGTIRIRVNSVGSVGSITNGAFGTGSLALNGGTLSSGDGSARTILNAWTLGGDTVLGNGTNNGLLTFSANGTIVGATRQITTNSNVTIDGNIAGAGFGLTKAGTGLLILNGTNGFTGTLTASAGTLRLGSSGAWNSASSNLVVNNAVVELGAGDLTTTLGTTAGKVQVVGATAGFGAVGADRTVNLGTSITWTGDFNPTTFQLGSTTSTNKTTFSSNLDLNGAARTITTIHGTVTGADAEISGILSGSAPGTPGLTFTGAGGYLKLSGANTYDGVTQISNATTVEVSSIGNWAASPTASNLGAPTTAANGKIILGSTVTSSGTLVYKGSGESPNRTISLGNGGASNSPTGTIVSSGSGALVISTMAFAPGGTGATASLILDGTDQHDNTISAAILNNNLASRVLTIVTKTGSGTWVLSNDTSTFSKGPLNIAGGTLVAKGGDVEASIIKTGNVTTGSSTITGIDTTGLTVGDYIYGIVSGSPDSRVNITAIGSGTITVDGTSSTFITAAGASIEAINTAAKTSPLGSSRVALTLGSAATTSNGWNAALLIDGTNNISRAVTVTNNATAGVYVMGGRNTTGTSQFSGNITLNQPVTLQAATGGTVAFNTGTWTTNDKAITIGSTGNTGTVQISNALSTAGGVAVNFGTLAMNSAFTGNVTVNAATLSGTGTVSGTAGITGGTVNGTGLTLTGLATFNGAGNTLSGTVTATTGVNVAASSTLAVNGTLTGTALVAGTGTLKGNGTVTGTVTINGTLAPGASEGKLTLGTDLVLTGTAALEIEGTTRGVNTGYDAVDVTGAVNYTGGTLVLEFQNGSAFADATTFDLLAFASQSGDLNGVTVSGFYGGAGTALVNLSGVWSGTFGDTTLSFSQGTGDLVVTVPEPGSLGLLALGGLGLVRRRRRRM